MASSMMVTTVLMMVRVWCSPAQRPVEEQPGCVASTTRRPAPIIGHRSRRDASCLCLQGHREEGEEGERRDNASLITSCPPDERTDARRINP